MESGLGASVCDLHALSQVSLLAVTTKAVAATHLVGRSHVQARAQHPLNPPHEPPPGAVQIRLCQPGNRVKLPGTGGHPGRGHCADDHSGRRPSRSPGPGPASWRR